MPTALALIRRLPLVAWLAATAMAQTNLDLRDLVSGRGLVIQGQGGLVPPLPSTTAVVGDLGRAVAFADVDGDGLDDLVLGAPRLPSQPVTGGSDESGHAYVIFGRTDAGNPASVDLELSGAVCSTALNLVGGVNERLGYSVADAGDMDGDGFSEVILGAPDHGPNFRGAAYLLWGSADLPDLPPTLDDCGAFLPDLLGGRVTRLEGAWAFGQAGTSVGGGVDVNGDGRMDVIVGAPLASTDGRVQNGVAAVVYGSPALKGQATVGLGGLGVGLGTVIHGAADFQLAGWSVAGLGRFDPVLPTAGEHATLGDEMAIGAPGTSDSGLFAGAVYVMRGLAVGSHNPSLTTAGFGGATGVAFHGAAAGDQLGLFVAGGGDLFDPGDGFVELLAAAPHHDPLGRADAGALYVLAGRLDGSGPAGFNLGLIGGAGGEAGLRLAGAVSAAGQQGVTGAPSGDVDADGLPDLAAGFPGATVTDVAPALPQAGLVDLLSGAALQPPLDRTLDLGAPGAARLLRLRGEATGILGGASLAAGDHDGDGTPDLALGAPEAPSDPDPQDPSGLSFSETGRGQVFFGPLTRIGAVEPAASWHDGPLVELTVFNLTSVAGLAVTVDGVLAPLDSVVPGAPGIVRFLPPPPAVFGATVDLEFTTDEVALSLAGAFTYTPLSVASGPSPAEVIVGLPVVITGTAFSQDLEVFVDGAQVDPGDVTIDPLAGTLSFLAPSGPAPLVPVDVTLEGDNGNVTLVGVLTYRPFVVGNLSPVSGPQDSGVFSTSAGLGFNGQPAVPVSFDMVTSNGLIPPETVVEFGTDLLGWREAEITSVAGSLVTADLPWFFLGPQTQLVDLRVTTDLDQETFDDAFTYAAGDFTQIPGTASAGFGASPPRLLIAGGFAPGETMLFILDNYPNAEIFQGVLIIGINQFVPPAPIKGGLLGVMPLFQLVFPGAFMQIFNGSLPFDEALEPTPDQEGLSLFLQFITVEKVGPATAYGFSDVMQMTARID